VLALSAEGLQLLGEIPASQPTLVFGPVAAHNGAQTVLAVTAVQSPMAPRRVSWWARVDLGSALAALAESTV
jgi:hypothetical protein